MRQHWPLIWDEYAIWHYQEGFDRPRPKDVLAMARRNLLGSRMVAAATYFDNNTLHDMPDYLNRGVDSPTKINYYFTHHLFDWMNASGLMNRTLSYGYKQPDGTWDGNVGELLDGRSDFSVSILWVTADRVPILNYVRPTTPGDLSFVFKKPSLATITNIYALPFSMGVWVSTILLVLVSATAMALGDFTLESQKHHRKMTVVQRVSQSIHDTLCLVFQQGTFYDPVTITGRQILLIGLMVFMFLYTAYSANVVALIQSTTSGITSVEALINSPLQCGAEDLVYQRQIFKYETRPTHRALWLKKGEPQAENFFLPIEEGIRRVREGLYAFHVRETSGSDEIQKTFLEHEKCNLGVVKYISFVDPHFTISKKSHFVEALRIGCFRLMENGVQVRSMKRISTSLPKCGAGTAMFTPVTILYVIPIFKSLLLIYAASLLIFVLEIFTHRRVYQRSRTSPLVWEEYGIWGKSAEFDRPHPLTALAMRRRDLQGSSVHSACVLFDNNSFSHMPDYLYRDVDTLTKVMYYMSIHLFEWMNGTGHINTTKSWGYLKPDGTYDGTVREMWDGRSDFSGSVLIPMKERMPAVEYILPPSPLDVHFIFRKPSLASVANIYSLPFSLGVWISIVVLILISSMALFFTSFREMDLAQRSGMTIAQRVSQGLHDTLCLVFQQGTAVDPISVSSRQILLLGLLAFMFLFTAYSANVVALLQSATNEINSVEALLNSPLQCGAQDVVYNREIFTHENRPIHRALWLKKGVPQGEQFFLSVEEGVRRVREGMYAFHVEPTAGYDRIKKTFLEHEKCNMGTVKYTAFLYPYVGLAKNTHIKEALRVGVIRILESGVQSRTTRRIVSGKPHCGAGAAMFTAVRLLDVAPAFKCMSALYAVAIAILLLEVIVHRREKRRQLLVRNVSASIEVD